VFFVQEPPASGQTGKVQFSQRGLSRRKILASEDLPDPVAPRMTMCGGGSSKLKPVFLKKGYSETLIVFWIRAIKTFQFGFQDHNMFWKIHSQ
jgi:hypothetical protein